MDKKDRKLYDSWKYKSRNFMEFNNPVFQTVLGLVIFYIGLKMFSGGMKSMSHLEQLEWFLGNPYWMFAGAIVCTLLWQSSSLTTTAVIGLVASGALPLPSAIAAIADGKGNVPEATNPITAVVVSDEDCQRSVKTIAPKNIQ